MSCTAFEEQVALLVSDDLEPAEAQKVVGHLEECARCADLYDELADLRRELADLSRLEVLDEQLDEQVAALHESVLSRLETANPQRRRSVPLRLLPWAAVLLLAAGLLFQLGSRLLQPAGAPPPVTAQAPGDPASTEPAPSFEPRAAPDRVAEPRATPEPTGQLATVPPPTRTTEPGPLPGPQGLEPPTPEPTTALAATPATETSRPEPLIHTPTHAAFEPKERARVAQAEPVRVTWLSDDEQIVIHWLIDTEETTHATSD